LQSILLAAPAGFNAYLSLLLVGLAGRLGVLDMSSEWGRRITNPFVLAALFVLSAWEVIVDKIPGLDTINNTTGTIIRPLAGGVLMLATPSALSDSNPTLAFVVGVLVAGGLHTLKTLARPVIALGTAGIGTPAVSTLENVAVIATVLLALVAL